MIERLGRRSSVANGDRSHRAAGDGVWKPPHMANAGAEAYAQM
jgi:hypothetical protein